MTRAVLLLSGGLDSGTLLTKLVREGVEVLPVTVHYGQKHSTQERAHAQMLLDYFNVGPLHTFDLSHLFMSSNESTLLNPNLNLPHKTYKEIATDIGPSSTYVPFRNSLLISMATAYALQNDASEVYVATHAEDARNSAYPDCQIEFNGPMAAAVFVGTYFKVKLFVPFQNMMKKDIVRLGLEIGVPFDLTWSCYEGSGLACGLCPTCVERLQAFTDNKAIDPIGYQYQ